MHCIVTQKRKLSGRLVLSASDASLLFGQSGVIATCAVFIVGLWFNGTLTATISVVVLILLASGIAFNFWGLSKYGCAAVVFRYGRICVIRPISKAKLTIRAHDVVAIETPTVQGARFIVVRLTRGVVSIPNASDDPNCLHFIYIALGFYGLQQRDSQQHEKLTDQGEE